MPRITRLTTGLAIALGAGVAAPANASGFCSATATTVFSACGNQVQDDYWISAAICINVSDDAQRADCFAHAAAARRAGAQLCREQQTGRRALCGLLGEGRYDPAFDPDDFDNPRNPTHPNHYFPLAIGNRWEFGGSESIRIEVLNATKLIEGVTCLVVNDRVTVEGQLVEDTDDWFALAKDGSVWYCGEEVKDFETFEGDQPMKPELVSIDGSFKTGRDLDKPGIIFRAAPKQGELYRQEFSLANAEDVAQVLSTTYSFGSDPELDRLVPQQLAELLCAGDCVVTREYTPIAPAAFEHKYYAPGIGQFLSTNPLDGEVVQLVDCNFDPRCAQLPTP